MDALDELEEIESRFESISAQYNDLSQAKASLEKLMTKLNMGRSYATSPFFFSRSNILPLRSNYPLKKNNIQN